MNQTQQRAVAVRPAQAIEPDAVRQSLLLSLTSEQLEVIRKAIAPGITDVELELFLRVARENSLSPWTSPPEIWAVPRRQQVNGQWVTKYTPTMGIDGWRKLLQRTGMVLDSVIEWCSTDGMWRDVWLADEPPAAARASIYVKGWERPQRFVCRFKEYAQYKDGGLVAMWKEKPAHMIGIRALSHCAKEVLRAVGACQLGDVDLGEWEPNEIAPERVAQRRFWATATDLGYDDATVRRAFHLSDRESLSEYIEHMGGWAKAQSYLEAWGDSVPSLPAATPGERASVLLYESEADPVHVDRETGEILDEGDPASEVGPESMGRCSVTDCAFEAIGFGPAGDAYCEEHLQAGAIVDLPGEISNQGLPDVPAMPDSVHDLSSFVAAIGPELGASRADLAPLGQLPRSGEREVWQSLWEKLAILMREKQGAQLGLGGE